VLRYDFLLVSTQPFRRSRSTQANEVVAAEVRNHIIWTNDEVRQRVSCRWQAALMIYDRTSARSSVL
jgi:hypothetical protein